MLHATKILFLVYQKFKFNWVACVLSGGFACPPVLTTDLIWDLQIVKHDHQSGLSTSNLQLAFFLGTLYLLSIQILGHSVLGYDSQETVGVCTWN